MAHCKAQVIDTKWKIPNFSRIIAETYLPGADPDAYMSSIHRHVVFNGVFSKDPSVENRIIVEAVVSLFQKKIWFTICLNNRTSLPSGLVVSVTMPSLYIVLSSNGDVRDVGIKGFEHYTRLTDKDETTVLFQVSKADRYVEENDGSLTLSLECYLDINTGHTGYFHHKKELAICGSEVLNDFEVLLKDSSTADFVIKASLGKTKSFHCHKQILAARSPIFRAMFECNMKETQESVVEVEDISAQAMEHFISFMYCGRFQDSSWIQSLPQLLYASEKYCVKSLKEMCDSHLIQCATDRNALTLAKLAERHELTNAAKDIRQFIAENIGKVNLGEWTAEDTKNSV